MKQHIIGLLVVGVGCLASAAEITFTGADTSNPTNLASAANWTGGALPGADNVGVVDLSQTPASGYVVNGDMALAGLKVVNNASKDIRFGGPSTLSLGTSGIVVAGKGTIRFLGPLETAAAQTWAFGGSTVETLTTITGTEPLVIDSFAEISHGLPPEYSGSITYSNSKPTSGLAGIRFKGASRWANDVYVNTHFPEIKTTAPVAWKTLFPGGGLHLSNAPLFCSSEDSLKNPVIVNDGDSVDLSTPSYMLIHGPFEQRGGTVNFHSSYWLCLGSDNETSNWRAHVENIGYLMSGGVLRGGTIEIGKDFRGRPGSEVCRFEQTGGEVQLGVTVNGGGLTLAPGGTSTAASTVEYRMEGGKLTISGGFGTAPSFCLCGPRTSSVNTAPPSIFTLEGGDVAAHRITFGGMGVGWDPNKWCPVNDGYACLDLSGGSLTLWGDNGNCVLMRPSWNSDPAVSNGVYSFKFHGGALKLPNNAEWNVATCFPKTDVGTVFGSDGSSLALSAPIWGAGKLVKEGAGTLALTDATRFTGSLDVREGVITMRGAAGSVEGEDECLCWTADSLVGSFENGAAVSSWSDLSGKATASTAGCVMTDKGFGSPTLKKNAYNGHAALHFDRNALVVPTAQNQLRGKKTCTVVAVLKPDASTSRGTGWGMCYGSAFLTIMPAYGSYGSLSLVAGKEGAGVGRWLWGNGLNEHVGLFSDETCSLGDGAAHAVVFTVDENRMAVTLDGSNAGVVHDTRGVGIAKIGWVKDGYEGSAGYGGIQIGAAAVGADSAYFQGDILELRVYPDRIFTVAEQRTITRSLDEKYGSVAQLTTFMPKTGETPAGTLGAFTSWTAPTPVPTAASWDADDIAGEDGAAVESWPSENGEKFAAKTVSGMNAPTLVKNAINGHAALRFSCAEKMGLGVSAADSPVSGAKNFTAAIVWRSTRKWASGWCEHRSDGPGLLSSRQGADKSADFTLVYRFDQSVMGGYGHADGDQAFKTCKPSRLDDGEVHISMLSCDGDAKTYKLMTDGVFFEGALAKVSERGAFDVLIGACRKGSGGAEVFFDGDIAAVKLYGQALTKIQMRDLGEFWAKKYASQLLVGYKYAPETIREIGLGATNVTVAAGACLMLPVSEVSPFTLKAGSVLSGEGAFLGTYRFDAGATFDLSSEMPTSFDELNITGGATIRVAKQTLGVHVRKLTVSGDNVVDVVGGATDLQRRETLLTFDELDVADGTTWTVRGTGDVQYAVRVDLARKRLTLYEPQGMSIILK